MKFKVGQKWQTRDGRVATIKEVLTGGGIGYPVLAQIGDENPCRGSFTKDGFMWDSKTESVQDLMHLLQGPDGWIEWGGGENPVPGATVEYRMRKSETCEAEADDLRWDHHGTAGDIVAYRVTEEAEHTQEPTPEPEPKPAPFTITEPGEYVTRDGRKVVVVALNLRGEFPVLGYTAEYNWDNACTWRADGRVYGLPSEHPRDIVDRWNPYTNVAIDTPVWVRDDPLATWVPRHFAGVKDGKPLAWANGLTSHTAKEREEEEPVMWDELSLTKPE